MSKLPPPSPNLDNLYNFFRCRNSIFESQDYKYYIHTNLDKTASKHTVRSSSILFFFRTLKSTNKKILCWHTYSFCPNTSDGLSNWAFHFMIAPLKSETGSPKSLLYHYTSHPLLLQKFILPKISCEFKDFYGKVVIETFPWPKQ